MPEPVEAEPVRVMGSREFSAEDIELTSSGASRRPRQSRNSG